MFQCNCGIVENEIRDEWVRSSNNKNRRNRIKHHDMFELKRQSGRRRNKNSGQMHAIEYGARSTDQCGCIFLPTLTGAGGRSVEWLFVVSILSIVNGQTVKPYVRNNRPNEFYSPVFSTLVSISIDGQHKPMKIQSKDGFFKPIVFHKSLRWLWRSGKV